LLALNLWHEKTNIVTCINLCPGNSVNYRSFWLISRPGE